MTRLTRASYIKIAMVILLCLVLCGYLVGVSAFFMPKATRNVGLLGGFMQPWQSVESASTGSFSVDASEVNDLSISWLAGHVNVNVVSDEQTGGTIQVNESGGRIPLQWSLTDGRLAIDFGNASGLTSCMPFFNTEKDVEILVPQSRAHRLGTVEFDAASGEHRLNGIGCAQLSIDQASGVMLMNDLSAKNAAIQLASGNITFTGEISDSLNIDQASGRSVFKLENENPHVSDLSLASGDMSLLIPVADFELQLNKASGSFNSDFDLWSHDDVYMCKPHDGDHQSKHASSSGGNGTHLTMDMMSGSFFLGQTA